jgi:hypothetical protein
MKTHKINFGAGALIAIIVSVIGLIASPVSAAAFPVSGDPSGTFAGNTAYHHAFNSTMQSARLQTALTNLSQQGVDVSQAQADVTAGNMTAAFQWLMAYHKANPDIQLNGSRNHAFNSTAQSVRLQVDLTNLSQQGVDVSQAQADVTAGNMTAAFQWLVAYHKANPALQLNGSHNHAFNSTVQSARLQTAITTLGQSGVDVSQVQADLTSGNLSAAMQWMAAYHQAHPVQKGNSTTNGNDRNSTRWQQGGSFRSFHGEVFSNQTAQHSWHPAPGQGS